MQSAAKDDDDSFNISSKTSLLLQNEPTSRSRKSFLFFSVLILFTLITVTLTLSILYKHEKAKSNPSPVRSSQHYCYLTMYPRLCRASISSLESNPNRIFSASMKVSVQELRNSTNSITNAINSMSNNSGTRSTFQHCATLLNNSFNGLNKSLALMGKDSDMDALTYNEMDDIKSWSMAAMNSAEDCFFQLQDIEMQVRDIGERKVYDEVRSKVSKARKYVVNSFGLLTSREFILDDFYNPPVVIDEGYDYVYYDSFDYRFIYCLYFGVYSFLALLYFLFLRAGC